MKFAYLLPVALALFCTPAMAQNAVIDAAPGSYINGTKPEEGAIRSAEAIIWSEDFANGIPASWNQVTDPSAAVWEYRGVSTVPNLSAGTRGSCVSSGNAFGPPIQSPSAANGFVIFDSNFWDDNIGPCGNFGAGEVPGPHFAALETESIDLSDFTSVALRFNQYCKNFQAETRVEYSIDGAEWELLWVNDVPTNSGESPLNRFDRINVSQQIGGESNVRLRFVFDGNYYFWMLDDIELFEVFENNLVINSATYGNYNPLSTTGSGYQGMEYSMYPLQMLPNVQFRTTTFNWGSMEQTGCRMIADLTYDETGDTLYSGMSNAIIMAPDQSQNFSVPAYQLEPAMGEYTAHFRMEQDQEDEDPSVSHITRSFEVSDVTYARDRLSTEGIYVPTSNLFGLQYEVGNFFQITEDDQTVESISIGIGTGSDPMAMVYGRIYKFTINSSGVSSTIIAETDLFGVTGYSYNNVGDNNVMTLPLNEFVTLEKDSAYLVVAGAPDGPGSVLFPVSGTSEDFTSMVRFFPNLWFYLVRTPLIRMNFGPVVGVEEVKKEEAFTMNCYPNPAAYQLRVDFSLESQQRVEFALYDQTGRVVMTDPQGHLSTGEHNAVIDVSGIAPGWYVATLTAGEKRTNKMIVIQR